MLVFKYSDHLIRRHSVSSWRFQLSSCLLRPATVVIQLHPAQQLGNGEAEGVGQFFA